MTGGGWFMTRTADGQIWAETSDPNDPYLAHPDPMMELTWWQLVYDETAAKSGLTTDYVPWPDHPTELVHPSVRTAR